MKFATLTLAVILLITNTSAIKMQMTSAAEAKTTSAAKA